MNSAEATPGVRDGPCASFMMPDPAPAVRISFCWTAQFIGRRFRCSRPHRNSFGQASRRLENGPLSRRRAGDPHHGAPRGQGCAPGLLRPLMSPQVHLEERERAADTADFRRALVRMPSRRPEEGRNPPIETSTGRQSGVSRTHDGFGNRLAQNVTKGTARRGFPVDQRDDEPRDERLRPDGAGQGSQGPG